ncbi:MAG TPA: PLP-dependent aspartate aminotransferase family protein [Methylophilaceae bacterium]|nr:PLP-dependent aspartate aminotransferase family protein [Methylophilaceae bacterium]
MSSKEVEFSTLCVHAGEINDQFGAPHTPLYNTTTFKFASTEKMLEVIEGKSPGFLYTRYGSNPSITSVEAKLAAIEQAECALAFSSGMAAISATLLSHGGNGVICLGEVYGGTWEFMSSQLNSLAHHVEFVAADDEQALVSLLAQGLGLVYFETPSNPLLQVIDIRRVCELAHAHGALVAIDSTFATPVNQQPLTMGADIVIHSATKYLGGHSDLTGGVVAASAAVLQPLYAWRKNLGQCMAPETAQMLARSLATLGLRVERQNASALRIALCLSAHAAIEQVYYPGLASFPRYEVAKRQMKGFGGMLSIAVRGGAAAAIKVVDALRLFSIAPSLGGVESLVSQPCLTSHRDLSEAMRAERGIGDNLIRLSIGIEDADDLELDLLQALATLE